MAKQYEMVELTWQHAAPAGDSDVYVELAAEVTAPSGSKITVKGFYKGDDTWAVRFLPLESGRHAVSVTGEITDQLEVTVETADDKHHGVVHAEGTHLKFTDGTCFYSFGTTVYALAHQTKELMNETFDTLSKAPFNKVRMCVFPKHYNYNHNDPEHFAFTKTADGRWDVNHPDFDFWNAFEDKMHRLEELGIQVDLILFHPYDRWKLSEMLQEDNLTYLDYLLRRFSAIPNVWWSLANEYDLCDAKTLDDWAAFEKKITECDPYDHMLSNHNCFHIYDYSRDAITHVSLQLHDMAIVKELQEQYHKPVLYDECCYEGNLIESWGNISGREMTNRFWKVTATGGYCTHGETFLDPDCKDEDNAVVWWAKGGKLIGESPARIAFLREIVENLPGPIDPVREGLGQVIPILDAPEDVLESMIQQALDAGMRNPRPFLESMRRMDPRERVRHFDFELQYAGCVGDNEALIWYSAEECPAKHVLRLPADKKYEVTVIDCWNMTKKVVAEDASGEYTVKLPGHDMMAVVAVANK